MALAIDSMNGRGLSNKARRERLPKKIEETLYKWFTQKKEAFQRLWISNKTERFSCKGEWAYT